MHANESAIFCNQRAKTCHLLQHLVMWRPLLHTLTKSHAQQTYSAFKSIVSWLKDILNANEPTHKIREFRLCTLPIHKVIHVRPYYDDKYTCVCCWKSVRVHVYTESCSRGLWKDSLL